MCLPYAQSVVVINALKDYEGLKKRYAVRLQEIQTADTLLAAHRAKSAYQDSIITSQAFQLQLRQDQVRASQNLTRSYKRRLVKSKVLNGLLLLGLGTLTYLGLSR